MQFVMCPLPCFQELRTHKITIFSDGSFVTGLAPHIHPIFPKFHYRLQLFSKRSASQFSRKRS